jgi:uncharacterized protein YoxC
MIIDISVGVIALAFVALVIYLILTLLTVRKTLRQAQKNLVDLEKNLNEITGASVELVNTLDSLTNDIKKKIDAFDFIFRPLAALKKERVSHQEEEYEKYQGLMDCIASGLLLFNKIKDGIKQYVKSR